VNKYEQIQRTWSTVRYFHVLWLKAVSEITTRQTRTSLRKHNVIKLCSIEYLTTQHTQIELVLRTFTPWTFHKIIQYLMLRLLSSLGNICRSTTAYFLTHPVCLYRHTVGAMPAILSRE